MKRATCIFGLALACTIPPAHASLSNGDFSSGLDSWTASGDTTAASGIATLGDDNATHSVLYQPVVWVDASFTLEFDYQNNLSDSVPQGTFPDAFYASIYLTDTPGTFDPQNNTTFNDAIGLFDLDANGAFNATGTIGASDLGAGWSHYSITLPTSSGYVVPYFELQDLNLENADSNVMIDNVRLIVPEPGTLALGTVGLLTLLARTRRLRLR